MINDILGGDDGDDIVRVRSRSERAKVGGGESGRANVYRREIVYRRESERTCVGKRESVCARVVSDCGEGEESEGGGGREGVVRCV